jgi:hypothetical protein
MLFLSAEDVPSSMTLEQFVELTITRPERDLVAFSLREILKERVSLTQLLWAQR